MLGIYHLSANNESDLNFWYDRVTFPLRDAAVSMDEDICGWDQPFLTLEKEELQ